MTAERKRVKIVYNSKKTTPHKVIGWVTKIDYGRRMNLDRFYIDADDLRDVRFIRVEDHGQRSGTVPDTPMGRMMKFFAIRDETMSHDLRQALEQVDTDKDIDQVTHDVLAAVKGYPSAMGRIGLADPDGKPWENLRKVIGNARAATRPNDPR